MKRIRILFISMMVFLLGSTSVFGITTLELQAKLAPVEAEIDANIEAAKADLLDRTYPVGSIYTTSSDISASDMHDMFGGTWQRMTDTFLLAADYDESPGETGGKKDYRFSAVLGTDDDDEIVYEPQSTSEYMNNHQSDFSFKSDNSFEEGSFSTSIPVTEGSNRTIEILPKYTAVRMFRRVS